MDCPQGRRGVVHFRRGSDVRRRLRRGNHCRHESPRPSSRDAMVLLLTTGALIHGAWTDPLRRRCAAPLVFSGSEDSPRDFGRAASAVSRWALLTQVLTGCNERSYVRSQDTLTVCTSRHQQRGHSRPTSQFSLSPSYYLANGADRPERFSSSHGHGPDPARPRSHAPRGNAFLDALRRTNSMDHYQSVATTTSDSIRA
jgi:hypothetical protein